jgi:hypothetical protein
MFLYSVRKDCLNNFAGPRLLIGTLGQHPRWAFSLLGSRRDDRKHPLDVSLGIRALSELNHPDSLHA